MSDLEETKAYKDAKSLVDTTEKFLTDDKNFHDHLIQWKSSIQWQDVIHGPVLEINEPFKSMTAFAERIHDDCAVAAEGGHVNDYQTRLNELKAKAKTLHEAFLNKGTFIKSIADAMKDNKDAASAEEGAIAIKLKAVDDSIDSLVDENKKRETTVSQLDEELKKISKNLQDDLNEVTKANKEFDHETTHLGHLREQEKKGLTGMKRMHRTLILKKAIRVYEASVKSAEGKKTIAEDHLNTDKRHDEASKTQRSKYNTLLVNLVNTKNNLILQKKLLETAKKFANDTHKELIDTSDKWYNLVGNVGILNNRLAEIENALLENYIPTIANASDLVVRAVNEGCRFLQYAGVEGELKATLEKIQRANDWSVETDKVKTLKKNLQDVQALIDAVVKKLPEHATEVSWFPQPLALPHGSEEM